MQNSLGLRLWGETICTKKGENLKLGSIEYDTPEPIPVQG
jgi:hypothetical protein